jgi:NitT/TauT family transport system substrate-binding protein
MLNRRTFTSAAALGATAIAVPFAYAQAKLEKTKVSIAVGGKAAFYYLPLTISEQLGYFKAEGLEVEISDFAGGSRALQAVVGGSADVCSGAFEHTINLQAKSQHFQCFVLQGRAPQIAVGVSTKNMPAYKAIADLKGKKIGVSAPGSSTNMVANLVLSRGGVKATEVSYIGVGVAAGALTALRAGQIDAISNTDPVMTMLEQKGDVKIISDTRTLKGTQEVFGGPMPAACLYASAEFIQKNPNTCQALANAIVHGLKWLQTAGPGDIIKTVPETYLLGDRAVYIDAFLAAKGALSPDGMIPDRGAETAYRALSSIDPEIAKATLDLKAVWTNDFVKAANTKYPKA